MEYSKQEYWSGLPFSSPGDFHNPGIKLRSPTLQADSLPSEPPESPFHTHTHTHTHTYISMENSEWSEKMKAECCKQH